MTYSAFQRGWIAADPFAGFRVTIQYRDRRFLSESELQAVMNVQLPNYKTAIVRDIFVVHLYLVKQLNYFTVSAWIKADYSLVLKTVEYVPPPCFTSENRTVR